MESLSSFIGVDGTNTTLNSGPHPDQLEAARAAEDSATDGHPSSCRRAARQVDGISLYMQPVQDISVEDIVSRTEYQYSMQDPNAAELAQYAGSFVDRLKQLPELEDVASDLQNEGRQVALAIRPADGHRGSASRAQNIDDTLYDSFGQRQVSTLFTQLNQYHVILEVQPEFRASPANLGDIYINSAGGGPVPLSAITKASQVTRPHADQPHGAVPGDHGVLQPRARTRRSGAAVEAIEKVQKRCRSRPR